MLSLYSYEQGETLQLPRKMSVYYFAGNDCECYNVYYQNTDNVLCVVPNMIMYALES